MKIISKSIFMVFGALAGVSLAFSGLTAAAENIDRVSASDIKEIMSAAGMTAVMKRDKQGNPVAEGKIGEINFFVRGMDCTGSPRACEQLVFFANFDINRAAKVDDLVSVNKFNERNRYGRAYVIPSRKQVGVDFMIDVSGGVSDKHVKNRVKRWSGVIEKFVQDFQNNDSA